MVIEGAYICLFALYLRQVEDTVYVLYGLEEGHGCQSLHIGGIFLRQQ